MQNLPASPNQAPLRPLERCVLRMTAQGLATNEIGRRLRRSPEHVERVRVLAEYKLAR